VASSVNRLLIFLACLTSAGNIQAQDRFKNDLKVMANYHFGFVLPEYSFVSHIVNRPVQALDIAFMKETYGRDEYEQIYKYPEMGVAIHLSTLGNPQLLGYAIASSYFFRVNLIDKPRFHLYNRMGIGIGFITRKHNFSDNAMNVAIGGHFNIYYNCRIGARYSVSDDWDVNLGLAFDHYSNANTSEPNIGLNNLTSYIGMIYQFGDQTEKIERELSKLKKIFYVESFLSVGGKHTRSFSNKYYFTSSTSLQVGYSLARKVHIGAGIDLFYDSSVKHQLLEAGQEFHKRQNFQSGIHFSQSIVYRKFRFTIQEGFYLGLKEEIKGYKMYNRGIIQYYVNDRMSVRLTMKSHLHILDYPEVGFGYRWK
jgi:hypothetical protein